MAAVKHARGVSLLIKVGDGASPEVFSIFCSINAARGISFSSTTNDFVLPDCDNPDQLAWVVREKDGLTATINGAGLLNTPDVQTFFDWFKSADSRNVKVVVDVPAADGGVIFSGAFHLTEFEVSGDRGAKIEASLTLVSDGPITSAANT